MNQWIWNHFYRQYQKEDTTTLTSGDTNTHNLGNNSYRFKPKPPPRNPNTTKTCGNGYYVSNEIVPFHNPNNSQKKLTFPRTIAQGSILDRDDFIHNQKVVHCNTESERIRDIGGEDADVSSQSSSSGVNVRSCTRLSSNIGRVGYTFSIQLTLLVSII